MLWYDGSIAEAVTLSKQRNAIFVVFVEGDNDMSQEMSQVIDDGLVVKRLSDTNNFLAVKLKSGSPHYTHFAQIYQFVPVPSLFFIGRNGTPLEVVCPGVQPDNLASRIDRILEEHHKEKPSTIPQPSQSQRPPQKAPSPQPQAQTTQPQAPTTQPQAPTTQPQAPTTQPQAPTTQPEMACAQAMQPSTSAQNVKQQTVNFMQAEAGRPWNKPQGETAEDEKPSGSVPITTVHEVTRSGVEYDVVCDGQVCARRPRPDQPDTSRPIPTRPVPAPSASAPAATNSLSDDKVERAKELIEAKKREKAEKEKELERQKELERRATGQGVAELKRWQADQELKQIQEERKREKLENNLARQRILEQIAQDRAERRARDAPAPPPPVAPTASTPPPTSGDGSSRARIQFKMPDGTSHTAHFDADGTVSDVRQYVANNLQLSASSFSIWTAFPRRELSDNDATLRGLQLTPSAALLVLPRRQVTAVQSPSNYATFLTFLTQLFTSYILEPARAAYAWLAGRVLPSPPPPARAARTPPPSMPEGVRRRTNVHRLAGEADDDNNTWNGNSTQQM